MKRAWNISGSLREHLIQKATPNPPPSPKLTILLAHPSFSSPFAEAVPTSAEFRWTRGICDHASSESTQSNTLELLTEKPSTVVFRLIREFRGPTSSPSSETSAEFRLTRGICDHASSESTQNNTFELLTEKPSTVFSRLIREFRDPTSSPPSEFARSNAFNLLIEKFRTVDMLSVKELQNVSVLKDELLKCHEKDPHGVLRLLEEKALALLKSHPREPAFVELLEQLRTRPALALEVLAWRRKQINLGFPMTAEEYSKAICISGRARNINLAAELFTEAANLRAKTSIYNSMLGAYMVNGLAHKCRHLFQRFKEDENCRPNIVTYNILISVFGRMTMVDQMEAILHEMQDQDLFPTLYTYNYMIAGYLTAWSWDGMENTFMRMKDSHVKPDLKTYLYMLRGYSYSGKLDKMEEMYDLIKEQTTESGVAVRCMISGYCESSNPNRVSRIDELVKLLSEDDYRPWLHVRLIKFYADEDKLEKMESLIDEAFERHIVVVALRVMRSVISAYFRLNAVDKLAQFVKRAEDAGWSVCRSMYHCQMFMYGKQNRLEEMEDVIGEMERYNISSRRKKTFCILYKSYMEWGQKLKAQKVVGLLWKCGYDIPENVCVS